MLSPLLTTPVGQSFLKHTKVVCVLSLLVVVVRGGGVTVSDRGWVPRAAVTPTRTPAGTGEMGAAGGTGPGASKLVFRTLAAHSSFEPYVSGSRGVDKFLSLLDCAKVIQALFAGHDCWHKLVQLFDMPLPVLMVSLKKLLNEES